MNPIDALEEVRHLSPTTARNRLFKQLVRSAGFEPLLPKRSNRIVDARAINIAHSADGKTMNIKIEF